MRPCARRFIVWSTSITIAATAALLRADASEAASRPTSQPAAAPVQPGPFEGEIRAFEEADRKQMPPANATLFVGSSSIRFWSTLAKDFPDFPTINRGFGGSTAADAVRYVDRIVVPYHPSRIVYYEGDNDLAGGQSPEAIAEQFKLFAARVHASLPNVPIYVICTKPSPSRAKLLEKCKAANALVAAECKADPTLHYIDVLTPMLGADGAARPELFRADKLHMNATGYALWTRIVGEALK